MTHGLSAYSHNLCRCEVCRTSWREYNRRYRIKNRQTINERARKARLANLQKYKEREARYRETYPERRKETVRNYYTSERGREMHRQSEERRRASKLGAIGYTTKEKLADRVAYYGGKCYLCGEPWEHMDHVIPLSRGGTHWPSNIRPACAPCNRRKYNKLLHELEGADSTPQPGAFSSISTPSVSPSQYAFLLRGKRK